MKLNINPNVSGKVVLITGASSGIGEAAAYAFAQAGAIVVLAARRAEELEKVAGQIESMGGQALAVPTDLTDVRHITHLVQKTLTEFGRIDVLANIAGWGHYAWYEDQPAEDLRRQFETNLLGPAELIRQVVPVMQRQRSGHILNMSSYASRVALPIMIVYAGTKYAVEGLSDGLRRELAPWGIHVTRIHPGGVSGTEFNQQASRRGGLWFDAPAFARVSREHVAQRLVEVVERPRRSVYIGRLYGLGVRLSRWLPGLVDLLSGIGVRVIRREALRDTAAPARRSLSASPAVVLLAGALLGLAFLGNRFQHVRKASDAV